MGVITLEYMKKGYDICKTNNYFGNLQNIYRRVPETTCNCCGKCCSENPGGSFVEFLNYFNTFKIKEDKKIIVENVIRNNLTSLVQQNDCLFLKNDKCSIYNERPLSCRIFGLESEYNFEKNYIGISNGNKNLEYLFKKKYGIDIISNTKLEYCKNVKQIKKRIFNDTDVNNLLLDLVKTEARFHKRGFPLNKSFDSYEAYISYLVVTELNMEFMEWGDLRVLVYKQIKESGISVDLEKFIEKIKKYDFEFLK